MESKIRLMKKSSKVLLGSLFLTTIAVSCSSPKDEWIYGNDIKKDTTVNGRSYRYYGGKFYPIFNGLINPGLYNGFTQSEMRENPSSIKPIKSGGFGSSSRGYSSFSS